MDPPLSADELRSTLEYYLSNDNLQKDRFFSDLMHSTEDGYIPIKHFLVCPKVRRMRAGRLDIRTAVEGSQVLSLNEKGDMIKRLKPYKANRQKRAQAKKSLVAKIKNNISSKSKAGRAKGPKAAAPQPDGLQDYYSTAEQSKACKKPLHILMLLIESDTPLIGERVYPVLEAIKEKVVIAPLYIRFDSTSGHLIFERDSISAANLKVPVLLTAEAHGARLPPRAQQAHRPTRQSGGAARVLARAQRPLRAHLQQEYVRLTQSSALTDTSS